jgi:predicted nucleic acid-binding protein
LAARYFDSSVILSVLLEEEDHPPAHELWIGAERRLSSGLLRLECIIAIRRIAILQGLPADGAWARERLDLLTGFLDALNFRAIDGAIEEIIRLTPALADCRTLDAIHVATALHFKPYVEGSLEVVTLDRRMKHLAMKLGFQVQPRD